jgi:hypothetical protein
MSPYSIANILLDFWIEISPNGKLNISPPVAFVSIFSRYRMLPFPDSHTAQDFSSNCEMKIIGNRFRVMIQRASKLRLLCPLISHALVWLSCINTRNILNRIVNGWFEY